ncbi:hypothetical protein SAMN02799630_00162 [Paenibacillus sp. UNCCL117]|uniref:hypothetical protein n=1 Tax=unclassified Paenibacillus TaxID=185978 RepID=UPI00088CB809|nr:MULTISPECIES: hypothetical protein [unclassified Paenibacillus]SDC50315.1 hypothetical protein SAMN04488602_102370 [Paenibacillus sp. cl123]SFW11619.1 hypothetical protein SAMN02799630_00162 [Paenibacillus sp. UNCCL117]
MLTYGSTDVSELKFTSMKHDIDIRDERWVDVYVRLETEAPELVPASIGELGALLVATRDGLLVEIAAQDEGRDCEYQFTESEKAQLRHYYEQQVRPTI